MRLMFEVQGDDRAKGFMRKKGRDNMKKLEMVLSISLDTFYSNKNYAARKI